MTDQLHVSQNIVQTTALSTGGDHLFIYLFIFAIACVVLHPLVDNKFSNY